MLKDKIDDKAQLGELAYRRIRDQIRRCELPPGAILSEAGLAHAAGMGKAPIRTALTRLAHEGLVRPERRRGYVVSPVTLQDIQEIFQLRLLVETEAARLAAGRLNDDHVRTLTAACSLHTRTGERKSDAEFLESNKVFHLTVAEASGSRRLTNLVGQLLDDAERVLHLGLAWEARSGDFQDEHTELLATLLANQPDKAAALVREQIEGGLAMVVQAVLSNPGLLADSTTSAPIEPLARF